MQHYDETAFAMQFKALAHPRRVRIFRLLIEQPETGRSFLSLHKATHLCKSSLAHHLRELERCGLIRQYHRGRYVSLATETNRFAKALTEALRLANLVHPHGRMAA